MTTTIQSEDAAPQVLSGELTFIDVRTPEEFESGAAVNAINIPVKIKDKDGNKVMNPDFETLVVEKFANTDQPILTSCFGGKRGALACDKLKEAGFTNVNSLLGGLSSWIKEGHPTVGRIEEPDDHHAPS